MSPKLPHLCLLAVVVLLLAGVPQAQDLNVLIWNNDNASHYIDPETGQERNTEYGIQQALQANGVNYTTLSYLPGDLSAYDIVFVALGIYCVG